MSDELAAQNGQVPPAVTDDMTDDDVLAYTRKLRMKVITNIMPTDVVPGDNSDRIMLTQMIEGLDRQAMGSKKLKQDQTASNNSAAIVAELLRGLDKNKVFQVSNAGQNSNVTDVDFRVVPSTIPDIPALPGEMDVAPPQLDYNSFVRSQGKDVDQIGKNVTHAEADDDFEDVP